MGACRPCGGVRLSWVLYKLYTRARASPIAPSRPGTGQVPLLQASPLVASTHGHAWARRARRAAGGGADCSLLCLWAGSRHRSHPRATPEIRRATSTPRQAPRPFAMSSCVHLRCSLYTLLLPVALCTRFFHFACTPPSRAPNRFAHGEARLQQKAAPHRDLPSS